jgi:hypothetical protein
MVTADSAPWPSRPTLSQHRQGDNKPAHRVEWGNCGQTRFGAGCSRRDLSSHATTVLLIAGMARFAEWRFKAVNMIGNGSEWRPYRTECRDTPVVCD